MHIINITICIIKKRFDFQNCNFVSTCILMNSTYVPTFKIFRRSAAEIWGGGMWIRPPRTWNRQKSPALFRVKMHALAAQGSEQKRKACINFTQVNLFIKWYCNGNTLPHNWNLWTSLVIILVQCNFFTIFQSTVIPVHYHIKFPKFVCNMIDLCTT